jgi:hypothetical protein
MSDKSRRQKIGELLFDMSAPSDAGEDYDAHTWDDPDSPGLLGRIIPNSNPRRKTAVMMGVIICGGFGLYLTRYFRTDTVAITTLLLAGYPAYGYLLRKQFYETFTKRLDWSILTNGKSAEIRYGRMVESGMQTGLSGEDEQEDDGYVFQPGTSLSPFKGMSFLEVRDVFGDRSNLRNKVHRTGKTGDTPAKDYLKGKWTNEAVTDTLGNVYITLTDGLERQPSSPNVDRSTKPPSLVPDSMVADIKTGVREYAEIHLPAERRRANLQKRRADELAQPTEEQVRKYMDQMLELLNAGATPRRMHSRLRQQHPEMYGGESAPNQGQAGPLPGEDGAVEAMDELDEQVNEDLNGADTQ